MKKKYELTDKNGRYITAMYDSEKDLFTFTMFLSVKAQTSSDINDVFGKLGFTKISETEYKEPKVIDFTKERNKRK